MYLLACLLTYLPAAEDVEIVTCGRASGAVIRVGARPAGLDDVQCRDEGDDDKDEEHEELARHRIGKLAEGSSCELRGVKANRLSSWTSASPAQKLQ